MIITDKESSDNDMFNYIIPSHFSLLFSMSELIADNFTVTMFAVCWKNQQVGRISVLLTLVGGCCSFVAVIIVVCLFVLSFSFHSRIVHSFETSLLPVKGCKFSPIVGTYGH